MTDLPYVHSTLKPITLQRGGRPAHVWGRVLGNCPYPAIRLAELGEGFLIASMVFEVTAADLAEFGAREGTAHGWYRRVKAGTLGGEVVWAYEGARCLDGAAALGARWSVVEATGGNVAVWSTEAA